MCLISGKKGSLWKEDQWVVAPPLLRRMTTTTETPKEEKLQGWKICGNESEEKDEQ